MLESELKAKSDHIRTIIKARGISFPNITGKTFAVFRVDNKHHLMSMVSMIDPSPDWIVGVSSLELCLRNCTWMESKVLNLYPYDVGTDDGITYLSPNQPSSPRQPIRRLRTNVPDDPRSPFYDISGNPLKPFARLTLTRQRLYEKTCDPALKEDSDDDANCETDDWSAWSACSVSCGRGVKYKQRRYKHEESKYNCNKKLTERATCEALRKYCPYQRTRVVEDPLCELGPWSEWSSCSVTCGKGVQTRDRKYKNRFAAKKCTAGKVDTPILQQNLECLGEGKCEDYEERIDGDCPENPWSDWSPCSVTCGKGFKERYRLSLDFTAKKTKYWPLNTNYRSSSSENEFDEDDPCSSSKETVECFETDCLDGIRNVSEAICRLPKDVGSCKSNIDRWYFDTLKGECEIFSYSGCDGNLNNFNTLEQCQTLCAKYQKELWTTTELKKKVPEADISSVLTYNYQNDANAMSIITALTPNQQKRDDIIPKAKSNCEVSKWSNWSACNTTTAKCGIGFREKYRYILSYPRNGGKACPKKLLKRKRCKIPCYNYQLKIFE
nr:spondin-1-like [Leptinotarsa decemlineata]